MKYIIIGAVALIIGLIAVDILNNDNGWFGWGGRPQDWRDHALTWWWGL